MFNTDLANLKRKVELLIEYPLLEGLILDTDTVSDDFEGVTAISTEMGVVYVSDKKVEIDFDAGTHAGSIRGIENNSPVFYAMVALESARLSAIVTIINNSRPAKPEPIPVMKPVEPTAPAYVQ